MTTSKFSLSCLLSVSLLAAAAAYPALAQDTAVLKRGDAVVTGFSGTRSQEPAGGANALDQTFIDLDGPAMQLMPLRPDAPPTAQLITSPPLLQIKARDVGQVFAITLDDGLKPSLTGATPNIYLGATSAYGLQIIVPGGDGRPQRVKQGQANAEWMAGQFGHGGGPGSIWKVDGVTGAVSLFATLPGNSGPGVGDIVYDTSSLHFYVSDLDTGLIHRIDSSGNLVDTFDHGLKAREQAGLPAVADDGATMDIHDPAFDSQDPATWRFTQPERRVWGMAVNDGRLYYAVAEGPSIWSISIKLDGSFGGDARREFEVPGTPGSHPISDIAFDGQGMMYLAQRGGIRGSYDYKSFTKPKSSVVFRYRRDITDKAASAVWVPVPEEFAIGFPPDHRNTSGGIALGYGYDDAGQMKTGQCGATLWSTGDNLRDGTDGASTVVHGLQGSDRMLVRPDNEPPTKSVFVDAYEGRRVDAANSGYAGDVEIWQPCDKTSFGLGPYSPMPYLPPGYVPPSYYPPGNMPPDGGTWDFNLHVDKKAVPYVCTPGGLGFLCTYTVRVTNTGSAPYIGPVVVNDTLPAAPAGATMAFDNQPPWSCLSLSATEYDCTFDPAVLWPGSSIDLKVTVDMPAPLAPVCHLHNLAKLEWPGGFADSNPGDDFDLAAASVPAAHCPPPGGKTTNLTVTKQGQQICTDKISHFACGYMVAVSNTGTADYTGEIKVDEIIPPGTTATFYPNQKWTCTAAAPYSCTRDVDVLHPGESSGFELVVKVPKNLADDLACKATNKVAIVLPLGNPFNTDATDDKAEATALIPGTLAQCPGLNLGNLKIEKTDVTGGTCPVVAGKWECKFKIRVWNFGKTYQNELRFWDGIPFNAPAGTTVSFQSPLGWQCAHSLANLYVCKAGTPNLAFGQSAEIFATVEVPIGPTLQCSIKNTATIFMAPAGTTQNTFAGDDTSSATAQFQPVFPLPPGQPYCLSPAMGGAETDLTITKTAGASTTTATGQNTPFVITVLNTGPGVYNGPIVVRDTLPREPSNASWSAPWACEGQTLAGHPEQGVCTHPATTLQSGESVVLNLDIEMPDSYIAPSGSTVRCDYTNQVAIEVAAGGTPQNSNAGDDTTTAQVHFSPFEKHGTTFCGIDDLTIPPPPVSCPQGWSSTPVDGKCCPPRTRWNGKRCTKGDPPDTCKPKTCDRDEVWDVGVCRCVDLQCPNDTVGDYPNCKPKECPPGYTGIPPNCTPRIVTPPIDTCKPKSCGRKETWNGESCSCVTKRCPDGFVGNHPRCKPVVVDPPRKCQDGFTGTPPNCKRIVIDEPKRCPDGFTGRPPKCKRIAIPDPPRKCPTGMTGKPPNCRKIVIHKPCPPGFTGTTPNCKQIKPQRLQQPPKVRPPKIQSGPLRPAGFTPPRGGGIRPR